MAEHPYASSVDKVKEAIQRLRFVMANHGDRATPLWITELGWGSAPPDGRGINLGPDGQARMLTRAFQMILSHRDFWNVQRLLWFHWRDPAPDSSYAAICRRCGSAGLLARDRTPKPAFDAFLAFTTDTSVPSVGISSGPSDGELISNLKPPLLVRLERGGFDFACRIDGGSMVPCTSPYTTPGLRTGPHTLWVEAIDAAGNQSAPASRSFAVDDTAPRTIIDSGLSGTTNDPAATFAFSSSESGSTFQCRLDSAAYAPCASPKTTTHLTDGPHTFYVRAKDSAGNVDPTVAINEFTVRTASVKVSGSALVVTAAAGAKDNLDISRPSDSIVRVTDLPDGPYMGSGAPRRGRLHPAR